jgi:hypothetical protein
MTKAKSSWKAMKARCKYPSQHGYKYYGGRGIKVCERWLDFDNFLADMGEPEEGLTLDRIDSDGDYEPDNCRWATWSEQATNKCNNRVITACGESKTLSEWAKDAGISPSTISQRLARGWSEDEAVSTAVSRHNNRNYKPVIFRGENRTLLSLAEEFGINYHTLRQRVLKRGLDLEQALNIDSRTNGPARWAG